MSGERLHVRRIIFQCHNPVEVVIPSGPRVCLVLFISSLGNAIHSPFCIFGYDWGRRAKTGTQTVGGQEEQTQNHPRVVTVASPSLRWSILLLGVILDRGKALSIPHAFHLFFTNKFETLCFHGCLMLVESSVSYKYFIVLYLCLFACLTIPRHSHFLFSSCAFFTHTTYGNTYTCRNHSRLEISSRLTWVVILMDTLQLLHTLLWSRKILMMNRLLWILNWAMLPLLPTMPCW